MSFWSHLPISALICCGSRAESRHGRWKIFLQTLPLIMAIQLTCLLIGGVYGGLWRYASIADVVTIGRSVAGGVLVSAVVVFGMFGWVGPSRSVFIVDALLLIIFLGVSRVSFRLLREIIVGKAEALPGSRPVFIYGAGDGGELLLREILNNPDLQYTPVGFVDDDENKVGKLIHGYRIFSSGQLKKQINQYSAWQFSFRAIRSPKRSLNICESLAWLLHECESGSSRHVPYMPRIQCRNRERESCSSREGRL